MTISPLFPPHRAFELPEETARFAHSHELASPKIPSEWLFETNALVLAETTYLRHRFTNKALLRRALRPLSREQARLARCGLDKIRRNIEQRANVSPGSLTRKDEALQRTTARASGCCALIIQYMEQPRKYGLHGLDALALGNTVAAMIGSVHLDVKQNLGAETGWKVARAMQALGFADVVAQVVGAWTLYSAERDVEVEVENEKDEEIKNEDAKRGRVGTGRDGELGEISGLQRRRYSSDEKKGESIHCEEKKMTRILDSR